MIFTQEQIAKAKNAKSAEELQTIAKENGMELTEEKAEKYFAELHKEGKLSDTELDAVAGGKGDEPAEPNQDGMEVVNISDKDPRCPVCGCSVIYEIYEYNNDHGAMYDVYWCQCCPPYRGSYRRYWTGPLWTKNY